MPRVRPRFDHADIVVGVKSASLAVKNRKKLNRIIGRSSNAHSFIEEIRRLAGMYLCPPEAVKKPAPTPKVIMAAGTEIAAAAATLHKMLANRNSVDTVAPGETYMSGAAGEMGGIGYALRRLHFFEHGPADFYSLIADLKFLMDNAKDAADYVAKNTGQSCLPTRTNDATWKKHFADELAVAYKKHLGKRQTRTCVPDKPAAWSHYVKLLNACLEIFNPGVTPAALHHLVNRAYPAPC